MKKRISLLVFLVLIFILSTTGIYASDLNTTDLESAEVEEDLSEITVDTDDSNISASDDVAVLESENSNNLSNNILEQSNNESLLSASKSTKISVTDLNMYYKDGSVFTVILTDSDGVALSNKVVTVKFGSNSKNLVTNAMGIAKVTVTLSPGTYSTTVTYAGDSTYQSSSASATVKVISRVSASDLTKYYKGSAKYTAKFVNSNGNPLANTNVKIVLNSKKYTVKTNVKGVATLSINLKPGTYTVYAYDPITWSYAKNTVRVLSTISANDVSKVYKDNKKFTATFLKSNGKALAKKYIKFKIDGNKYKVKTNKNGVASLSLKNLKKGTYKIVSYNKDGLTKSNKVKVIKKSTTTLKTKYYEFLKSDTKKIKVKLLDKYNYGVSGKIIKIKINGKTYSKKTNSNGNAKLTLPSLAKGFYKVKYKFSGTSYYYSSSASNKVAIFSSKNTAFTVKSSTVFGEYTGTSFKVALTASSVPLPSKVVKFTLNGKSYQKTTDSNGVASIPINLSQGTYSVAYSFGGTSKLSGTSGSCNVVVKPKVVTNLSWESETTFLSNSQTVKVLLSDSSGNPISGKVVKLTVNYVTYNATTSSSGYATFSIKLPAGTYTAISTFVGDDVFVSKVLDTKITVKYKYSKVSQSKILDAAVKLSEYYSENLTVPSVITINGFNYTDSEFLYLMSKTIVNLGKSKSSGVEAIPVANPVSPEGDELNSLIYQSEYLNVASRVANYIADNRRAPNFASSSIGNIHFMELVESFSRILAFYEYYAILPGSVKIVYPAT